MINHIGQYLKSYTDRSTNQLTNKDCRIHPHSRRQGPGINEFNKETDKPDLDMNN